ncbi:MAG TPA: TolC family protein, partial [Dongiaceae bacterium]|nr:TolC family protein [Dongiaceae bacterium]
MARQATNAAALAIGILMAGPAAAETLPEALAKAYLNNPTLLAARAELRATDERVPQALSGWRPTVSATAEVGEEWEDSETGGSESRTPRSAALRLSQPIYRGGRTVAGTSQAENLVEAQRAALSSVEQDVLLRAATAYMDAL